MPDEGVDSLPADQLTASPLDQCPEKISDSMQDSPIQTVPVTLDKSDANQKVNSEMDRVRREKQLPFRSPELRGPTAIKSELVTAELTDGKKQNLESGKLDGLERGSESITAAGETGDLKDDSTRPQEHSLWSKTDRTNTTVNGTTRLIDASDVKPDTKASSDPINFDDATLAHRMWAYLQNKQIEVDDGRRAWVNAYYGVRKQAEELERKKTALEKWRDQLVTLEEQLPVMEKKLGEDADALYKRRKEFDEKQKAMIVKRREFVAQKQALVEWSRVDDNSWDRMIDHKTQRRPKHSSHHHGHHSHPIPPSNIHMLGNEWTSPISTPESQLDDYSLPPDNLVSGDTDMEVLTIPPGPTPKFLPVAGAGPSGTSKKGKGPSQKKTGLPPPPPPPDNGSQTSLASTLLEEAQVRKYFPFPSSLYDGRYEIVDAVRGHDLNKLIDQQQAAEAQQGKGKGKLVNFTDSGLTNALNKMKEANADSSKGLWKKAEATKNPRTWLEKSASIAETLQGDVKSEAKTKTTEAQPASESAGKE